LIFNLFVPEKKRNFALVIELQRHIEILLLTNDCVIVPDFGGFMAHHVSAHYDIADRSFFPPKRTLGFNPQLRLNDSVLAQSYVEAYDISYPEALRRIEEEVEELKNYLSEVGSYLMEDLGTLSVNQEGNYEFEPCEAGILSPELYGLDSYLFKRLKDDDMVEQHPTVSATEESIAAPTPALLDFTDYDSNDDRAIVIKMSWIRNAVAMAAAIIAFFFMATPVANSDWSNQTMSQLQNKLLYKLIPQDTNVAPATPVTASTMKDIHASDVAKAADKAKVSEASKVAETDKAELPTTVSDKKLQDPVQATNIYCIVVASQVKMTNAEIFVEQLHKDGYKDAKVDVHNNVIRVLCGEFQSESEAYRQLNKMNVKEEFAEAWVYKKKA
jgi:hypothetical protein